MPAAAQYSLQMSDDAVATATASGAPVSAPSGRAYNLKLGPTEWTFGAGLTLSYTSNAQMASSGSSGSWLLSPNASINMYYPIAERTALTLGVTIGYSVYLNDTVSSLNGFYVMPNSRVGYTMYIGDVQLSFYDTMSASQFAYQDPTVTGGDAAARTFGNAFGVSASTLLYRTSLSAGFTQNNSWQLGGTSGVGDTGSQNLFAQAGYQILPELTAGLNGGLTWMHYNNGNQTLVDGGFQWNVGPYAQWTISEQLSLNGAFGYTVYTQDYLYGLPSSETDSMYWRVGLTHRVSTYLNYSLSAGHTVSPNYYAGPTDAYNVSLSLSWHLVRGLSISTPFSYYNGVTITPNDYYGFVGLPPSSQRFQTYGAGINFGYPITKKLTTTLGYSYNYRQQDSTYGDYTVNYIFLGASYRF